MVRKGCVLAFGGLALCIFALVCLVAIGAWYANTPEGAASIATSEAQETVRSTRTPRPSRTGAIEQAEEPSVPETPPLPTNEPVPTPSNVPPTTVPEPTADLPPLEDLTQIVREETDDPEPIIILSEDGYLAVTYRIPENFESFLAGTFRTQLRQIMARIATISPEIDYIELSIIAYGVVGTNPDAVIGFAAYDKATVENNDWINLTNDVVLQLAIRYNINDRLE